MPSANLSSYWTTDRIMRLLIGLAVAAVVIYFIRYLSDVLLPFFAACFIAYLLQPIVAFNKRLTHARGLTLPALLTVLDMTVIIALVIYLFLPSVVKELDMLGNILHDVTTGKVALPPAYRSLIDFESRYFNPDTLTDVLNGSRLESLLHQGTSILAESIDVLFSILSWLLTLIYVLFILIDYPQICRGFKLIIPAKYREGTMSVVRDVEQSMNHYFRGQGLVALCAMIFYCTGFSLVGLPLAIPMGIIVGVLYMIPYFQYVTLIPVAIICFIYSLGGTVGFASIAGKCALVYVISQSVCDYVITPHVMGREMGLNPAVILLSLSVWGSLLGIIGMIIALPVTALIMTYYQKYISNTPDTSSPNSQADSRKIIK